MYTRIERFNGFRLTELDAAYAQAESLEPYRSSSIARRSIFPWERVDLCLIVKEPKMVLPTNWILEELICNDVPCADIFGSTSIASIAIIMMFRRRA